VTDEEFQSRYHVRNDSPAWLKPRRTVYFITKGWHPCEIVDGPNGGRRWFKTRETAQKACDKLNASIGVAA